MTDPIVLRLPHPSLIVLVGAAGAGKSTFAARHFAAGEVLSSDAFRATMAGDAGDQRVTRAAFAALHRAIERRLAQRLLTVVDATNVQAHARNALVARAVAAAVPAVAVVLDLPAEVVLARNAERTGSARVPEDVVRAHLARLIAPAAWAQFAEVYRLTSAEDVDRVIIRRERG